MTRQHRLEVFTAGCPVCEDQIEKIKTWVSPDTPIERLNMDDPGVAERARKLGICCLPSLVIDGEPVSCGDPGKLEAAVRKAFQ